VRALARFRGGSGVKGGRVVAIGLALCLLMLILFLGALGGASVGERGSALSTEKAGRRAAYLVLEELGFATEVWRDPPGLLPAGRHVLWMPRAPEPRGDEHAGDPLSVAREDGALGRGRYLEFMEQGGTLVLPATEEALFFLEDELGLEQRGLGPFELEGAPAVAPGEFLAGLDGELFELQGESGELFAVWTGVGDGYVALLAGGRWLDNGRIGEGDAGLVLARTAEYLAGPPESGARILFDEQVFGGGAPPGPVELAFAPDARLFSLHLLLLALLVVWWHAWVREFPRDPEPLNQLSPLARARAQSSLLVRAGRVGLLADSLRAGTLRRIGARLRGSEPPPGEELASLVHRVAAERGHLERAEDWTAVLADRTVTDLAGLVQLDHRLRTIEREAGVHTE